MGAHIKRTLCLHSQNKNLTTTPSIKKASEKKNAIFGPSTVHIPANHFGNQQIFH